MSSVLSTIYRVLIARLAFSRTPKVYVLPEEKEMNISKERKIETTHEQVLGERKRRRMRDVIQSRGRVRWIQDRRIACLPGWSGSRVSTAAITAPPRLSPFLYLNHHLLLDFLSCYQRRPARPTTDSRLCARKAIRAGRR